MTDIDVIKLLGQGGIALVAIVILGRVVYQIGQRMIAAIDRIGTKLDEHSSKIDEHSRENTAAINDLRTDLAVLNGRVSSALEWSGVTPPIGVPETHGRPAALPREGTGQYSYHRPPVPGRNRGGGG